MNQINDDGVMERATAKHQPLSVWRGHAVKECRQSPVNLLLKYTNVTAFPFFFHSILGFWSFSVLNSQESTASGGQTEQQGSMHSTCIFVLVWICRNISRIICFEMCCLLVIIVNWWKRNNIEYSWIFYLQWFPKKILKIKYLLLFSWKKTLVIKGVIV